MKSLTKILAISALCFAPVSFAATIDSLYDSFEGEGQASSVLNYNSFVNWDVSNGTVDLIKNGNQWGIVCSVGSFCVDLDGSTGDAGILSSKNGFSAGKYKVSFGAGALVNHLLLDWDENWHTYSFLVDLVDGDKLSFRNFGGDNVGAMLDNIRVSAVPIPAAVWLFGSGLMGFLAMRRRVKSQ